MIGAELKELREAIGLKQTEMAQEMGLAVRLYQQLEADKEPVRQRHVHSAERVSLHFAVTRRNPMIALPTIRQESLELVDMIRGHSPVSAPTPTKGQFRIVEIQLGPYGEMFSRKLTPHSFQSWKEAAESAAKLAATYQGAHGKNDEHGYWWGRTIDGKVSRFVVEAT